MTTTVQGASYNSTGCFIQQYRVLHTTHIYNKLKDLCNIFQFLFGCILFYSLLFSHYLE